MFGFVATVRRMFGFVVDVGLMLELLLSPAAPPSCRR